MNPKKIFFPLFLGILLIIGLFSSLNTVQATNYEWIIDGGGEIYYANEIGTEPSIDPIRVWYGNPHMIYSDGDIWWGYSAPHIGDEMFIGALGDVLNQDVNYLDSDTMVSADLWTKAHSTTLNSKVRITAYYSDGSNSYADSGLINYASGWVNVDYGVGWVSSGKLIKNFRVSIISPSSAGNITAIDDISIIGTQNPEIPSFIWYLNPNPISITVSTFSALQGQGYVFYGNISGQIPNANGTFYAYSDFHATILGSISNGLFSFSLTPRNYLVDTIEWFHISLITSGGNVDFWIEGTWVYNGYTEGGGGEEGNIPNTNVPISTFINFILLLCFIVLPAIGFGFYCGFKNVNPLFGFIGALTILTAVGYLCTLVPLWFFATTIIVDVVLGLYIFNSSRSGMG